MENDRSDSIEQTKPSHLDTVAACSPITNDRTLAEIPSINAVIQQHDTILNNTIKIDMCVINQGQSEQKEVC